MNSSFWTKNTHTHIELLMISINNYLGMYIGIPVAERRRRLILNCSWIFQIGRGKKSQVGSRCNFFKVRRGHQYQFGKCFIRFRPLQNSYQQQPKRQGYGAIKTWEKKIFYDLLWPNEISDLNNFNTEDFPRLFFTAT